MYLKTVWKDKDIITKNKLNNIEDGISNIYTRVDMVKNRHNDAIYISDFKKPSNGDYTEILQDAVNMATEKNMPIIFPAGVFMITDEINCPSGATIELIGNNDAFANSMNRKRRVHSSGVGLWYEKTGSETLIIFNNEGTLFKHDGGNGEGTYFKFKNISFRNATSENGHYLLRGRVVGQRNVNSSSKGKVYAENCIFSGFKVCFGDKYVTEELENAMREFDGRLGLTKPQTFEKCCVVALRCRFVACGCGVNMGVDSRFVDCSFNSGWYGLTFLQNSGYSTVSSCRLEWLKINGVYIIDSHDITISANEFDRIGWAGIRVSDSTSISITNNMIRRSGSDTSYDKTAITKNVHVIVENCRGGVISNNTTVLKPITDDGSDNTKRPTNSYCIRNCSKIALVGNDWSGSVDSDNNRWTNNTDCRSLCNISMSDVA